MDKQFYSDVNLWYDLCCSIWKFNIVCYRCKLKADDKLLVHGASGAVGIAAVQISKSLGMYLSHVPPSTIMGKKSV